MKKFFAAILIVISLFMFLGFLNAGDRASTGANIAGLCLTVLLPAVGAFLLLRGESREKSRVSGHKAALRQNSLESEILRLATRNEGKLLALEAGMALHLSEPAVREVLDRMVAEGRAELEVTDGGHLVYAFPVLKQLADKRTARGILDE
ncbi:hypothetical protein [Longimicrobium terrae]|uniref:Uncharacterized protein n=1 Tax=Longimicrobium terrae TaxID=1639882 RepID=A0A841GXP3_9BACT|nr:hypothetical protein [Longimicrobium terrae]MBB4636121.1 hypothetical protein [Longimicrobium terrae]MBB6070516.1 hypothetical protein [Longimicrobium terrae]NNC29506.1 hypothetical protein [Longimicrobium terrae]